MLLQEKIEEDLRNYIKNKYIKEASVLKLIVSEFQKRSSLRIKLTDLETHNIIKKFIKNEEKIKKYIKDDDFEDHDFSINLLNKYLTKIASIDEIRYWIHKNLTDTHEIPINVRMKYIGQILKNFSNADRNQIKTLLLKI